MQVIAINATGRKHGATTQLTERFLEGAGSKGARTEMVLLLEKDLRPCNNCLQCYRDLESDLAPCSIQDDMTSILDKLQSADGILLSSPVHNGFATSRMVIFFERLVWRMCRPTLEIAVLKNCPAPRTKKVRALATIMTAGGIPDKLRRFCDGTPWLKENGTEMLNAQWVGDLYAAAHLKHQPTTAADYQQMYFLRKLSKAQLQAAYDLGVKMANLLDQGSLRPEVPMGPVASVLARAVYGVGQLYQTVEESDSK